MEVTVETLGSTTPLDPQESLFDGHIGLQTIRLMEFQPPDNESFIQSEIEVLTVPSPPVGMGGFTKGRNRLDTIRRRYTIRYTVRFVSFCLSQGREYLEYKTIPFIWFLFCLFYYSF